MIAVGIQKTDKDSVVVFNHSLPLQLVLFFCLKKANKCTVAVLTLPPSVCLCENMTCSQTALVKDPHPWLKA